MIQIYKLIMLYDDDNVLVVLGVVELGLVVLVNGVEIMFVMLVMFGYKVVLKLIWIGVLVVKYGMLIGVVIIDIELGEYVYVYNIVFCYIVIYYCDDDVGLIND